MKSKKIIAQTLFLVALVVGTALILRKQQIYRTNEGKVFGTIYHIKYQYGEDLQSAIEDELARVDHSLSPFNKQSVITAVNQNQKVQLDSFFCTVIRRAQQISLDTDGAFDITVAPLVNAWGFGFKSQSFPDSSLVDSLMQLTGYQKIRLENGRLHKEDPRILLDCSSIAKGFGCDVVARLFDRLGIDNYLIEIGGEVVARGHNPHKQPWGIGVSKPVDDSLAVNQELQTVLRLTDIGMATSGNYRNFYFKDGKKYAHTIDPHTGRPVQHSLLSSTVISADCMTADAYATAFMVMGLDRAKACVERHPELEAYFIFTDSLGQLQTWNSEGLRPYLQE